MKERNVILSAIVVALILVAILAYQWLPREDATPDEPVDLPEVVETIPEDQKPSEAAQELFGLVEPSIAEGVTHDLRTPDALAGTPVSVGAPTGPALNFMLAIIVAGFLSGAYLFRFLKRPEF